MPEKLVLTMKPEKRKKERTRRRSHTQGIGSGSHREKGTRDLRLTPKWIRRFHDVCWGVCGHQKIVSCWHSVFGFGYRLIIQIKWSLVVYSTLKAPRSGIIWAFTMAKVVSIPFCSCRRSLGIQGLERDQKMDIPSILGEGRILDVA